MNAIRLSTRTIFVLAFCVVSALVLSACSAADNTNSTTNTNATTTTSTTTTTTAPAAPAATASVATNTNTATSNTNTASTAAAGDKIGVEECDDYIAKYEACISAHVPEASRAAMKTAFEQSRAAWRQAASTPQGKASLAQACKTARDAAKQATAAYGCTF